MAVVGFFVMSLHEDEINELHIPAMSVCVLMTVHSPIVPRQSMCDPATRHTLRLEDIHVVPCVPDSEHKLSYCAYPSIIWIWFSVLKVSSPILGTSLDIFWP
jgi:hypothetical protein